MKFAYFVRPHIGGTYSVFRHLRAGLAPRGIEVKWVGMAEGEDDAPPGRERASGFLVAPRRHAMEIDRAAALIDALVEEEFDGVFVNVLADRLQMNIARYLPAEMLRIMIVHNITPGTYAAALALRDSVHAAVGVSERCRRDLVERHGFPARWTRAIPNAVDVAPFSAVARSRPDPRRLRLVFLGRVEDASKGVYWLGDIMAHVAPSTTLTVVGDGPDLASLRNRLAPFASRVSFMGGVSPERVPRILAEHDALVAPSRFEGFCLSIVEAMAAGCVPVVSRIDGVTDRIVSQGASGLLFPVGDWQEAVRQIAMLERQPALVERLSGNARRRAGEAFSLELMADAYFNLIQSLDSQRPVIRRPLPLENWAIPWGMRPGLRTYVPRPVKNWLRTVRERT